MPMPGKSPEEEAKQGALQYAKGWGGMSTIRPIQTNQPLNHAIQKTPSHPPS